MPVDLDYTKQIRIQMNVPERLMPIDSTKKILNLSENRNAEINEQMNIPEKLMVTGNFSKIILVNFNSTVSITTLIVHNFHIVRFHFS